MRSPAVLSPVRGKRPRRGARPPRPPARRAPAGGGCHNSGATPCAPVQTEWGPPPARTSRPEASSPASSCRRTAARRALWALWDLWDLWPPPPLRRAPPAPASGRGRPARGRRFRPQLSQRVPSSVQKAGTGRPPPSGGKATTAGLSRAKCGQTPAGPSRVVAKPAEPPRPAQDRGAAAAGAALRILPRILPESCPNPLPPPARPGRLPSLPPQRLSVRGQRPARRAAR